MDSTGKRMQAVYAVVAKADGKDLFLRVGNAFVNRDGSTTVLLDAIPISGKLHVRDYFPREAGRPLESRDLARPASSELT